MKMILETKRLIIRKYQESDIDSIYKIFSDKKTMAFWPRPFRISETESWIKRNIESYNRLGFGRWPLVLKDTGKIIGDCGIMLTEINKKQEYDLGYIIFSDYWGKGLATEAAKSSLEYGIIDLKLHRICVNMPIDHIASKNVAEKIGMTFELDFNNKRNRNIRTLLYSYES